MNRFPIIPFVATLAFGLALFFSGCASGYKPTGITVTVANVKVADATVTETRLLVTLRYTSESLYAFGISGSSHKLYLNGNYVGKAVSDKPLGLPPLSTSLQDANLVLENSVLLQEILKMQGNPVVKYRLESVLYSKTGDDESRLKTSSEGSIDLSSLRQLER